MRKYSWRALCAVALLLAGCADNGPLAVYTQAGVAPPPDGVTQYPNANPQANFAIAAQFAQSDRSTSSYQEFMRSGFSLIYIRCNEYFDQKGSDQANANLIRDSIGPIAAVISGILALHTFADSEDATEALGLLALGTSTATAGLDTYDKHFLFGAENTEAVRTMVNEELNTHASLALQMEPRNIEEAALQITDNQRICIPSHILASARTAIANERFAGSPTGVDGPISSSLLTEVGTALGLTPPTVTETQAGLLFATTMGLVRTVPEQKLVRLKLSALPEIANPIAVDTTDNFSNKPDFPFATLRQIFDRAPAATRLYLLNQSKVIMGGAARSADADAQAIRNAVAPATVAPDANLRAFMNSPSSEYNLPAVAPGALRRIRVTGQ